MPRASWMASTAMHTFTVSDRLQTGQPRRACNSLTAFLSDDDFTSSASTVVSIPAPPETPLPVFGVSMSIIPRMRFVVKRTAAGLISSGMACSTPDGPLYEARCRARSALCALKLTAIDVASRTGLRMDG